MMEVKAKNVESVVEPSEKELVEIVKERARGLTFCQLCEVGTFLLELIKEKGRKND